jgi:hypothetical protein
MKPDSLRFAAFDFESGFSQAPLSLHIHHNDFISAWR